MSSSHTLPMAQTVSPSSVPSVLPATAADLRLLVRLVRSDPAGVERALACRPDAVDVLARLAIRGGLSVVLLQALDRMPLLRASLVPELLQALQERQQRQERRREQLLQALDEIAKRFDTSGQSFILLKGPYLATRFYGDLAAREYLDIDLLVPRRDRARACGLLSAAGFRRGSRTFLGEALTSVFVHGFDFVADGVNLDLHWALSRHLSLRLDEDAMWNRRGRCQVAGRTYNVLGDADEVIFAVLGLMRDIERARPKLKNLLDLVQILAATDAELDWRGLLVAQDGTRGPLVNVLGMCLDLADAHDLAPRLSLALSTEQSRRIPAPMTSQPLRFAPHYLGLGNKLWVARAYDSSLPGWLMWWAMSLPFRVAAHRWRGSPGPFNA